MFLRLFASLVLFKLLITDLVFSEGLLEFVDLFKIFELVPGLFAEELDFNQSKNDFSEIKRRAYPPVMEHRLGHGAELIERVLAYPQRKLPASDVPWLFEPADRIMKRGQNERVGLELIARVFFIKSPAFSYVMISFVSIASLIIGSFSLICALTITLW